ncbi:Putative type I restriction enzyme specificity protein MPN_638 [Gallibacterium anatis]|uniref:Type I restriction enzyme specificity protein MPN_638 n=1 Tax=Gallibacterium anatis TaxID=750 RepID=A0A377H4V7_9PAST|nr:restriction endonuclease subunit S [Gallibacterium anatis]KGQ52003.1 restriction endonuclease HindVIIP subunit S [Gallibacterium anatis DSM 16844 = F 149]STO37117.1 Putative type I restriction enzyme specificity protein MPN_638 [Gallibacterium anatis]
MKTLEHFLKFKNGKSSPARIEDGLYPVFGSNGIIGYSNQYNTSSNTIIIGRVGSYCGSIYFSKQKCWVTDNAIIVNAKSLDDDKFWYYFLKNLNLNNLKVGSGQPLLNQLILKSIPVPLELNVETRKNISNTISIFDQKIELNTQTNQTLEQIAQAIFKHWFIDFAPVHAKANALAAGASPEQAELATMASLSGKTLAEITALQHTTPEAYHQLQQTARAFPSEFVESEMGLVPKGWEVKKIDEVLQKIPVGKKYNQKTTVPDGKIPVLDQGKSGIIGFHNDTAGVKANIQDPVIVFANHTCYMRLIHFDFSTIQNVFAFKGKNINIYWIYLATLGKQKFVEYKGHFPDFLIKQIVVPPKELTEIFGNIVKDSFSKIALNLDTNETLAKTRDLLLPRLLSGEIEL